MLPIVLGGTFVVVLAVLLLLFARASQPGGGPIGGQPIANISCDAAEQVAVHYHAHLEILAGTGGGGSQPVPVPAGIGINQPQQSAPGGFISSGACFYWLHTHDTSGIIHIEAPQEAARRQFTLGEFFQIWGQPLTRRQVATVPVGQGQQLRVWVDGKPYTGDPSSIVLRSHEDIVLEVGPAFTDPPPTYQWDNQNYPR